MKDQHELETAVRKRLDEIKPVPPRNPQMASRGRAQFLGKAVSAQTLPRQKGWISIFRKERYVMNIALSILVIAGLLFGGGATVKAAQDDLPNEPLYAVKTWTEDLSLQFQNNQEEKVNRLMELVRIRVQEMEQLTEAGQPIPDRVRLRLEQHIQQALQICANMDDPSLEQALLQIRDRLQERDHDMQQLQLQTQEQAQLQTRTRTMLHEHLQLVEEGLLNHEMFRNRVQNGQAEEPVPPVQNGNEQRMGQPTEAPGGPNTDPGGPNTDPGGPNTDPGGGQNNDSGGTNSNDGGSGGNNKP